MTRVTLDIPGEVIEQIAQRAAAILLAQHTEVAASPYLTIDEAARYLRCTRQRLYDLCSSGRLTRHKDGRRVLISRTELDAHLAAGGRSPIARLLPPARQTGTATGSSD